MWKWKYKFNNENNRFKQDESQIRFDLVTRRVQSKMNKTERTPTVWLLAVERARFFPRSSVQSPLRFNRNKNKRQWNLSTQKYRSAFQSSSAWTWSNARCARRIQCNLRKIWTHPMIQKLGIDWTRSDSRSIERIKCFPFCAYSSQNLRKDVRNIVL